MKYHKITKKKKTSKQNIQSYNAKIITVDNKDITIARIIKPKEFC